MSTTPIDTWAVDLADVTVIYPWVGTETIMVWVAVILWIVWHVWQVRHENAEYKAKIEKHGDQATIDKAVDDHHEVARSPVNSRGTGQTARCPFFFGHAGGIESAVLGVQNRVKTRCPEGRKPLGFGGFFSSVRKPVRVA